MTGLLVLVSINACDTVQQVLPDVHAQPATSTTFNTRSTQYSVLTVLSVLSTLSTQYQRL